MAELYDKLNLVLLFWFLGNFCCEAGEDKAYNLCMSNDVVSPKLKETGLIRVTPSRELPESQVHCQIRFSLCKSCRLWLQFKKSNLKTNHICYPHLSSHCYESCDYLRVVDEIYKDTHTFLFQPHDEFTSVSNQVNLTLCNNHRSDIRFEVQFRVEAKINIINPLRRESFKSPGFPSGYALNGEEFMYQIVKPNFFQDMLVTFTDWIMSPTSTLTVYMNGGSTLTFYGNSTRPVFASRRTLQLTFNTGTKSTGLRRSSNPYIVRGFKAVIICRNPTHILEPLPNLNCGPSMIEMDYGGLLKFSPQESSEYDCVWVISIHPDFKLVAVQLETFRSRFSPIIEFYEGLTSEGRLKRTILPGQNFVSQNPNGFYIRLRGRMEKRDLFALAYSSSSPAVESCPFAFKCKNGFCIQYMLKCDGTRHCLDRSDETDCYKDRPNPNQPIASNWSVSIIIPVVITIFIFIILCLFFISVRRFRKIRRGSVPHRQTRVASIGGSLSQQYLHNHFSMNLTLEGELDAPPSYEEVMNTPPSGNWNLAFNWSQQDLRDTPAPPPYSEYMNENGVNNYNGITDYDMSDLSTVPTDTSSSNHCTDPTSEDRNSTSTSGSDTLYSDSIYATICETPTNSLDRWMIDRSTCTSEEGIEMDSENNKIIAGEPETHTDQNNHNFTLPGADSHKSSPSLEALDRIAKDDPKNNTRHRNLSIDEQLFRPNRSRSTDSESNSHLDISQTNAIPNRGNKNGSSGRRNSYPSVIFLTDKQLNNEVFV